jgi:hypothetical protein
MLDPIAFHTINTLAPLLRRHIERGDVISHATVTFYPATITTGGEPVRAGASVRLEVFHYVYPDGC